MSRTRVKFCGMTRVEDAMMAAAMGVDAIGLVLTARSRRCVAIERAAEIRRAMPVFVNVVTLLMDDDPAFVAEVVEAVRPDLLQFHGAESAQACRAFGLPYMKAIAMGGEGGVGVSLDAYHDATALLFDAHAPGEGGGSGKVFDWARIPAGLKQPVLLAGGLHAGNVGAAIDRARPWAVDVASGIESSPGVKDPAAMRAFMDAVGAADARRAGAGAATDA